MTKLRIAYKSNNPLNCLVDTGMSEGRSRKPENMKLKYWNKKISGRATIYGKSTMDHISIDTSSASDFQEVLPLRYPPFLDVLTLDLEVTPFSYWFTEYSLEMMKEHGEFCKIRSFVHWIENTDVRMPIVYAMLCCHLQMFMYIPLSQHLRGLFYLIDR